MAKSFFNKPFYLEVWGDYACFTRPEMKVERVSYDVITPSAARAIFEAIFWKPAIRWRINKIEVLNPIKWISVRRNEVARVASTSSSGIYCDDPNVRQQRAGLFLRNVRYRLHAELEFVPIEKRPPVRNPAPEQLVELEETFLENECKEMVKAGKDENPGKYNAMFERRAKKGQCFNRPYLGCREFSCMFRFIEDVEKETVRPINESRDLGFMLYDMDFSDINDPKPAFFKAEIKNGMITVPPWDSKEVKK